MLGVAQWHTRVLVLLAGNVMRPRSTNENGVGVPLGGSVTQRSSGARDTELQSPVRVTRPVPSSPIQTTLLPNESASPTLASEGGCTAPVRPDVQSVAIAIEM